MENLTKENVYVKVESKEQAEMYKAVLKSLKQPMCNSFYIDAESTSSSQDSLIYSLQKWTCGNKGNCKEVSFGQLIDIITKPEKIAVRVENEQEAKAIFKFKCLEYPVTAYLGKVPCVIYMDDILYYNRLSDHQNGTSVYKVVPFSDFAKEHNIRLPIITTVDGVDLFEGDWYFVAHISSDLKKWALLDFRGNYRYTIESTSIQLDTERFFSTKQAAEKWIQEQNSIILSPELSDKCNFSLIGHSNDKTSIPINILTDIHAELYHAESKHPDWPNDKLYGASIVAEEFGEMMREAVKIEMNEPDASVDNLRKEAIQTAATCIRLLKNL